MTATLSKNSKGTYFAWCDECCDGWLGSERIALKWQFIHNNARHPE